MQPQNWSPVSGPEVHGANLLLLFAISKAILTLCVLAKRKVLGPVVLASHRRPFGLCENATYINAPPLWAQYSNTLQLPKIYKSHQFSQHITAGP